MPTQVPISTQWLLDAVGDTGRSAVNAVCLIFNTATQGKGTGFALKDGPIITNEHVIRNASATSLEVYTPYNTRLHVISMQTDESVDLAALVTNERLEGGLDIFEGDEPEVGSMVATWGYPLGYNGPSPLLSVGHLSGFIDRPTDRDLLVKHFVVNGAFNPGNSGGPLLLASSDSVIGVVVSKHAPMTRFQLSALRALASTKSGIVYTATMSDGSSTKFMEAQLVADLISHLRDLTQVMIGEAIHYSELQRFVRQLDS